MNQVTLSADHTAAFAEDGYLIIRELFDQDEMAGLLTFAKSDSAITAESYVRKDASGGETRLAVRNDLDDGSVYTAVVRASRVAVTMESLLGDEVYHYHHKMMLKEPRVGGAWEWHQDYGYWYSNGCLYPDMGSCLIAVDRATRENGCLQVLRGSHRIGRVDHIKIGDQTGADPDRVSAAVQRHDLVHCEMNPGDALFFHGNLLHRSDKNESELPRWSLICCYNTRHNDPYIREGRHPNYSPLEIWNDDRVRKMLTKATSSRQRSRGTTRNSKRYTMSRIAMLGTGLIGTFYTEALHGNRGRDRVHVAYSRSPERVKEFAEKNDVPKSTTDMDQAIGDPDIDTVIIALPNHLHEQAVIAAADAGKSILCTKPLGRNAGEALRMLQAVEKAGVFHGYLEDLVYTPKTLKALRSVRDGSLGKILWVRSRETHSGPHSDWFWNQELAGGGAIIDLGCHCVEIARSFIGKDIRPVEVVCWGDTQVHPIETEDHAIGLVRYENGAVGQFEVSWTFRGGMDLRDEVVGTEGTVWLNHWLRTGMEMYTAVGASGYVAEKSESSGGWLFPVGDEPSALGYVDMFTDMFDSIDQGTAPRESFYDGYIVNAIIDAAYRSMKSKQWESIELEIWRGREDVETISGVEAYDEEHVLIKKEVMPDGRTKLILRHNQTGEVTQRFGE